jgi:hypothetical protein
VVECGLDSSVSGLGLMAGCCEHHDDPSGFVKGKGFLLAE